MIKVNRIIQKPTAHYFTTNIFGISFISQIVPPNVFVIDSIDNIEENTNISFEIDSILYKLKNIQIHSISPYIIECRSFSEEVIF